MYYFKSCSFLFALYLVTSSNLFADDWVVLPRVSAGFMSYDLSTPEIQLGPTQTLPADKFAANTFIYGIGMAVVKNNYFVDVFTQKSTSDSDSKAVPELGYIEEFDAKRKDFSLSIGTNVWKTLKVFIGYKSGSTDSTGSLDSSSNFKETGYYLGSSYSWLIAENGVLSINAAVADLDGVLVFSAPALGGIDLKILSEAIGASAGIAWSTILTKSLGLRISVDANYYQFENGVDTQLGKLPDNGDVIEKIFMGRMNLTYKF